MRISVLIVGATSLCVLAAPVSGSRAADDYVNTCVNASGDDKIAACTLAINSGRWSGQGIAWAFRNRGNAYDDKGQYDRAIQDYDQAFMLDPNLALAFNDRGNAYANKGQYDRAIQDYDQAIKLDPNLALAINNRAAAIAKLNK